MNKIENINKIQKIYSDFGNGDIQGILDALSEDILWIDPGYPDIPFASNGRTKKEVPEFFKGLSEYMNFIKFEPREFFADGENVIVKGYHEGTTKPSETFFGHEWMMLWKFNNSGKVYYYKAFIDTNELAKGFKK